MKVLKSLFFIGCMLFSAGMTIAESTTILIGGEGTELSPEGGITGNGASETGGLGAAVLDTFTIHYQPLGEGEWMDNVFPDPEFYSFQMNIEGGLPDYQCQGVSGNHWDSRGRNGEGRLPWVNEDHDWFDQQYRPTGEEPLFGVVRTDAEWAVNYWGRDQENRFKHTCLAGTVEEFTYDDETGDATALLVLFESAYLGYGEDNQPGPGLVDYPGGAYQGFDIHQEPSGPFSHPAYFFEYDGGDNTGSITPCGTKVKLMGEDGWVKGYFDAIQGAIDAAEDGDTVLVSPGTYVENIDFLGKDIFVGSLFLTTEDTTYIDSTVIDGDSSGTVVTFESGETEDALLTGFTICNGYTDGNGGGIRCSNSSPTICNCNVVENYAQGSGGGISCEPEAHPVITDCFIASNSVGSGGGGIWIGEGSNPVISNCRIIDNHARWNGAGVNIYMDCSPMISDCTIDSNWADGKGGGIIVSQGCSPVVTRCNISYNYSCDRGGGILVEMEATPTFLWCAEHNNGSDNFGGLGMACIENCAPRFINCNFNFSWTHLDWVVPSFFVSASHPIFVNCILYFNDLPDIYFDPDSAASSITIANSNIEGGRGSIIDSDNGVVHWLEGNIDADPRFTEDFTLSEGSPCINAGTAFFVWEEDTLVDMPEDEYNGEAPDMGAFESNFADVSDQFIPHPSSFILYPPRPNPFNAVTNIRFDLPMTGKVALTIYDLSGRKVAVLADDKFVAGRHSLIWNAENVPSGIYIARLHTRDISRSVKLMLIR